MSRTEILREAATKIRERAEAASPSPWYYNGYSAVFSGPMVQVSDDFWSDERLDDGHSYDHRAGQICPACGERPAIGNDGKRFGTYWDCEFHKEAYDADSLVAGVPAQYGDTATGRHQKDAVHVESWDPNAAFAVAELIEQIAEDLDLDDDHDGFDSSVYTAALNLAKTYLKVKDDSQ